LRKWDINIKTLKGDYPKGEVVNIIDPVELEQKVS